MRDAHNWSSQLKPSSNRDLARVRKKLAPRSHAVSMMTIKCLVACPKIIVLLDDEITANCSATYSACVPLSPRPVNFGAARSRRLLSDEYKSRVLIDILISATR